MRKTIYILLMSLITLTSCDKWLDVAPNTDVPAKELFTTENGFMSSLAGLYIVMTEEDTYGKNLSFGLVEQLAQMYDKLPDGTTSRSSVYIYDRETSGAYNTKGLLANTWQAQYHTIANANNLLKWWEANGETVLTNPTTRSMIRGEALALRAFLHFDLLRGWGPMNYAASDKAKEMKCIPYRTVADHSKQPLLPAKEVVDSVIRDLQEARECLSYEKDIDLSGQKNGRCRRFNYHAVNALLARVYNYAGMKDSAAVYARRVIEECGLSLQTGNDNDPILSNELICGLSMHELQDNLSSYFAYGDKISTKYYLNISTLNSIFESVGSESEDMRAQGTAFHRNNELQYAISLKYIDNDNEIIPLIRLPEMYYIACENASSSDAATYINTVRNKRGISKAKDVACDTEEQCLAALNKEYRKEFYGEGQYFWFLKTHGITGELTHCPEEVVLVEENFVFPLPDAELEYGWTAEEEATEESTEEPAEDDTEEITPGNIRM